MDKKQKIIKIITTSIMVLIFLTGLIIALYPTISNLYGKYVDSKLMTEYDIESTKISNDNKSTILDEAVKYNKDLINKNNGMVVTAMQNKEYAEKDNIEEYNTYNNMLKNSSSSIMCTINIPKIAVTVPVYHWSTDDVLNKGIGHIHGSSLPVGCGVDPEDPKFSKITGSRSLFIGHRGLPSLKLFSDLDKVDIGDVFYVKTLGDIYAYKVCNIDIVLPEDVENLKIEPGRDLCTLITCTPYGVNTHRILVTGERIPYKGESIEADTITKITNSIDPITIFGVIFIVFLLILVIIIKRPKRHKKEIVKGDDNIEVEITSDSP